MASNVQQTTTYGPIPLGRRIYGFGSVFGKTLRDSRRAILLVGVLVGLILIAVSQAIVSEFNTVQSRKDLAAVVAAVPPILQGLAGKPVNVETLGGYLQYKYGTFFPIVASLWSILALSGTLAAEARRGSLEFVAAAPISRRRLALQKLSGHVVAMLLAVAFIFLSLVVVGRTASALPGDVIPVAAAAGYALWFGLIALAAGSVAFALAPFVGRGAAMGIAGAITFGGFVLNGYQAAIPSLAPLANLTWFGWTTDHIPLAGVYSWASLVLVAAVPIVLFAVGVEAFARRDIGAATAIPSPGLPRALVGLHGPTGRTFGHNQPGALGWGIGLGVFGLLIAGSAGSFAGQIAKSPDFMRLLGQIFPRIDFATVGGFLELLFVEFGLILAGLAAATLVAGWASDETSGRLEFLLATPRDRARWVFSTGLGIVLDIAIIVGLTVVGIALGAALAGGEIATPAVGSIVLGLFAMAMAGIGFAVGGVFGAGYAGPVVAIATILTWALDILAPALGLPDVLHELALTGHYGLPMLGHWDAAGVIASIVLLVGGLLIGAWGFGRRDLRG
jgi:ABC-2 type transport system permease protein